MHTSTKEYVQRCVRKLMSQCGISIHDIVSAIHAMPEYSRYHDVDEYYRD